MKVFIACYGSPEPAHIERIRRLYEELDLQSLYQEEERRRYNSVVEQVRKLPKETSMSPDLFLKLLDMIYDRKN